MATQFVNTNLAMEIKWGKEQANNKMLRVDLFSAIDDEKENAFPNEMIRYAICKQDDNKKFSNQFTVNVGNNYAAHFLAADEMLKRVTELFAGKQLESSPIVIDNSPRNYKDATKVITFDAYHNKEKNMAVITIKLQRKEKAEDEKFETEIFYFGTSKTIRRFNKEEKPCDYSTFQFFLKLKMVLQGLLDGSSVVKTVHYKKIADLGKSSNNNDYKNKSKSERTTCTFKAKALAEAARENGLSF